MGVSRKSMPRPWVVAAPPTGRLDARATAAACDAIVIIDTDDAAASIFFFQWLVTGDGLNRPSERCSPGLNEVEVVIAGVTDGDAAILLLA